MLGFGKQQDVMPYKVSRRIDENDMTVECVKEKVGGKEKERKREKEKGARCKQEIQS